MISLSELLKKQTYDFLYHGTTVKKAESIKKNGFSVDKQSEKSGYGSNLGISLTYEYEIAKEHSEWASKKFKDSPFVIIIPGESFNIMQAEDFEELGSDFNKAYALYKKGEIDGIDLCNRLTGDGCEEFEVFIFNIDKLTKLVSSVKI